MGGTKILVQAFDRKLGVVAEKKVKTDVKHGKRGFLNQLYGLITPFFHKNVKGIGIAVPGIVDYRKGILVRAPHLPTGQNLKLRDLMEKRFKTPVWVDHDINAFLAAEHQKPALKKYKNLLAVMVGTGLGGAAVLKGELYYGENGFAGEFGHMVIDEEGVLKTLEQRTSGHFLPAVANSLAVARPMRWNGRFLAERLAKKDPNALKILSFITQNLGIGLANLNLIFNPEAIVLGGSVYARFISKQKAHLKSVIRKRSLNHSCPTLLDAKNQDSVAKGAVLLLTQKRP